jgi:hypothetical protein
MHGRDILDDWPNGCGRARANMLSMNRSAAKSSISPPRRFILLPEETACGAPQGPRVRRYRLSSFGLGVGRQHTGANGSDISTARNARESGGLGGM